MKNRMGVLERSNELEVSKPMANVLSAENEQFEKLLSR